MNSPALVLYFDGKCAFCTAEMHRLGKWDTQRRLAFVDIAASGFDPAPLGVDLAALNRELHSQTSDGRVLSGIDSMLAAYTLAGRGWLVWPLRVPGLRGVLARLYRAFARNRYTLSHWLGYRPAPACDSNACSIGNPFLKTEDAAAHRPRETAMHASSHLDARGWVVRWMYAAAIVHLLVGAALPWLAGAPVLEPYHRGIEQHFWASAAPAQARSHEIWWIALLGATVQCTAIWMLALVHLGNRLRLRSAWRWLLAGLLIWAPQDMLISLQAQVWSNVAADTLALLLMVPPLLWLSGKDPA
jgi:predicted DCC family thiol-disulfide oxidoreductase YuxK